MADDQIHIKNRKAYFEYEILDKYIAGLQLKGTEIKSIRAGKANLNDGYCYFRKGELYVKNLHISEYIKETHYNHDPLRVRKLLLKKSELNQLEKKVKERGHTIIPLRLFVSKRGWAKLEVGLAKGKKLHDKRETIKRKDMKREVARELKRWK